MEEPTRQVVPAGTHTQPQYRGVGGWLLFFIVSLTIFTPAFHGYIVYNEWKLYHTTPSSVLFDLLAIDWAMRAILIVLGIYAGIRLRLASPGAPYVAKTYLMAVFAQQVVLLVMGFWIAGKFTTNPEDIGNAFMQPLRSVIYVVIWYSYLNKSQRVAATFPDSSSSKL